LEKKMEGFNTCEYSAERKAEGKFKFFKFFMLTAYVLYSVVYFLLIYITRVLPLGALLPITLWIIIYFTWGYTKPDYKYVIEKGMFTFYVSYGKKKDRKKTEFKISSADAIAPKESLTDRIKVFNPKKCYSAVPSIYANNVYAALYTDSKGKRCVLYFVAIQQSLKLMHLHNQNTVIADVSA
jgi:hypothetical protein